MSLYKRVYPKWSELWTEKKIPVAHVEREKTNDAMEE